MLKKIQTSKIKKVFSNLCGKSNAQEPSASMENGLQKSPAPNCWVWGFSLFLIPVILIPIYKFNRSPYKKTKPPKALHRRQQLFLTPPGWHAQTPGHAPEQGKIFLHHRQDFPAQRQKRRKETQTFLTTHLSCPALSKSSGV